MVFSTYILYFGLINSPSGNTFFFLTHFLFRQDSVYAHFRKHELLLDSERTCVHTYSLAHYLELSMMNHSIIQLQT